MDKQQYKRVMEQIQMPESCEKRILETVQTKKAPTTGKLRFSWKKKTLVAVAVAMCVGVVSVFSVAAVQNINLMQLLFPEAEEITVSDTAVRETGKVEDYSVVGLDDMTITPIGVLNDAKTVYLVWNVVPENEESLENISWGSRTGYSSLSEASDEPEALTIQQDYVGNPILQSDGSYQFVYRVDFANLLPSSPVNVTFDLVRPAMSDTEGTTVMGTISATVQLGESVATKTVKPEAPLALDASNSTITEINLQAFSIELYGVEKTKDDIMTLFDEPWYAITSDGTRISIHANGVEQLFGQEMQWHCLLDLDAPIHPDEVASIQIGEQTISLDSNK